MLRSIALPLWFRRTNPGMIAIVTGCLLVALFTLAASLVRIHPVALGVIYVTVFLIAAALIYERLGFDTWTIAILIGGLCLYLGYMGYTGYAERNYDGPVQLEYIRYVATHGKPPPPAQCLICHHPPLYYFLAAGVLRFFEITRLAPATVGLQIFSLLLFMVLLAFAVKTMLRFTHEKRLLHLATALVVFWPYSVLLSVRVHNDALAGTLMAAALYYTVRFHQDDTPRDILLAGTFTALGLATKSSTVVMVALLLSVVALKLVQKPNRLRILQRAGAVCLMFAAALTFNAVTREPPASAKSRDLCHRVLGNACDIGRHQWVGNESYNYLYIDARSFLKEPYLIAEKDGSGRELFWNNLVKTSLFGTHNRVPDIETSYEVNRNVAGIMNGLLFVMTGYLGIGFAFASKPAARKYGILIGAVGSCVAFMIAFRAMIPAPHHTDFRHIFVVLVPMTLLYVTVVGHARSRGLALEWVGRFLAMAFVALSIFYYVPKRSLIMKSTHTVVSRPLASYGRMRPEGTLWDEASNLIFEENQRVELTFEGERNVREIDISLDNNDGYEIVLEGQTESRVITVGPHPKRRNGLARYTQRVDPPVAAVRKIRLRALSGDQAYSMGHMILR